MTTARMCWTFGLASRSLRWITEPASKACGLSTAARPSSLPAKRTFASGTCLLAANCLKQSQIIDRPLLVSIQPKTCGVFFSPRRYVCVCLPLLFLLSLPLSSPFCFLLAVLRNHLAFTPKVVVWVWWVDSDGTLPAFCNFSTRNWLRCSGVE